MKNRRKLVKLLEAQNFTPEPTANGHVKWYTPDGVWCATEAPDSGNWRSHRNFIAELRRHGADIPGKDGKLSKKSDFDTL